MELLTLGHRWRCYRNFQKIFLNDETFLLLTISKSFEKSMNILKKFSAKIVGEKIYPISCAKINFLGFTKKRYYKDWIIIYLDNLQVITILQ